MSGWWRCPCGDTWMSHKCGCGNDHYSTDGVAVHDDGVAYDGPRLCSYDQYRACENPDICHGNLINGHCAHDTDFKPEIEAAPEVPTTDWQGRPVHKLHSHVPMHPDGGRITFIDNQDGRVVRDSHIRRTEEEIWSSPYCAVNRGHCAIMDSDSGEACAGVGFCIWRLASETFNPWAVDLCIQNTDNIITDAPAVGSSSPHYHEDANRYKEKLPKKPEDDITDMYNTGEYHPERNGQNLEKIMGIGDRLDQITRDARDDAPDSARSVAYYDAMDKALEEDQRKLDELSAPNIVMAQEVVDRLLGRQQDTRNPKDIAGSTKPQYHLVPVTEGVVRVMELGAKKYGPYNWREQKIAYTAYVSAAMRHMKAFLDREDRDPESMQLHIEHAAACMLIMADAIYHGAAIDDRPHNPKVKK